MTTKCPIGRDGLHRPKIEGTVRSAMTYTVCTICGQVEERGEGAFFGQKNVEHLSIEERISNIEKVLNIKS